MAAIKVLIVEDSELVAEVLKEALESDKRIKVVGVANNGKIAIEMMPKLAPDLVTMDVWMPIMDGFATVEWIMANKPTPILVITSSKLKEDVQISLRMLSAGALDVIEKPMLSDESQWKRHQADLISRVRMLAGVRVITHVRGRVVPEIKPIDRTRKPTLPPTITASAPVITPPPPTKIAKPPVINLPTTPVTSRTSSPPTPKPFIAASYVFPHLPHYQVVAIASSTGGPTALLRVLEKLPPNLPCGVLIVQHIAEGFTQGLVDWLQREVSVKLKIARDGDRPLPGEVLVAPDRRDISVRHDFKIVTSKEGDSILCPNADTLMHSIARTYGARGIGVILTGMGGDGAKGLRAMHDKGAFTIAQNEATSLIYGMPRVAVELGGVKQVLPLDEIPTRLIELLQEPYQPKESKGQGVSGGRNG